MFKVSVNGLNGLKNLIKHSFSIVSSATFKKNKIIIKRSVAYKTQKTILINPLIPNISINYNREERLWTRFLECKDEDWETYVLVLDLILKPRWVQVFVKTPYASRDAADYSYVGIVSQKDEYEDIIRTN